MNTSKAHEDLAYIRELMHETRQATYAGGAYFIVWGAAVGLGVLFTWLFASGVLPLPASAKMTILGTWALALGFGQLWSWRWPMRRERRQEVQSTGSRLIGLTWLAVGVGIMITLFVGAGAGSLPGTLMCPLAAIFTGIGVFMTGALANTRWLQNLAFAWWIGGAAMFVSPGLWNLWMMALMLLAFYIVPGIILSRSLGEE